MKNGSGDRERETKSAYTNWIKRSERRSKKARSVRQLFGSIPSNLDSWGVSATLGVSRRLLAFLGDSWRPLTTIDEASTMTAKATIGRDVNCIMCCRHDSIYLSISHYSHAIEIGIRLPTAHYIIISLYHDMSVGNELLALHHDTC